MMLKEIYSPLDIASLLDITRQGVDYRAKREGWQSQKRKGRGGGKEWLFSSMPEDTRLAIRITEERLIWEQEQQKMPAVKPKTPAVDYSSAILDDKRRSRALAKADLVGMYRSWQKKHGKTVHQKKAFVTAYLGGTWPELLKEFGTQISWKSLERWKLDQARAGNISALIDKRGIAHKGRTNLTEQHRMIILGQILNPNAPNVAQCTRHIKQRCIAENIWEPSEPTVRRFVRAYASECYGEFTLWREGKKAWGDKCAVSILRDWNTIEVGDIVIADGHTLNFESIDPETGKPKRMTLLLFYDGASNHPLGWEIMATENVACISSAFRRTCMLLGKFPRVVYLDNGKAFRAKFFSGVSDFQQAGFLGLYHDLGCEVIHAWPYHGQSKTIERFFGTFHDLEVFMPSYTGNSIDAKPARMKRGELLHRQLYDKMGGRPLTLAETHYAVAYWFEEYARRPQHRTHLEGKTPGEVFEAGRGPGVDLERLTLMMLQKEIKTISKDGIRHQGRLYWHEALANRRHTVLVRYDDQFSPWDVRVYTQDGEFICQARDREHYKIAAGIHPAAKALGTAEQQQDLLDALELKKHQEKEAGAGIKLMLDTIVLPETEKSHAAITAQKQATILHFAEPKAKPVSAAEKAAIEAMQAKECVNFDTKSNVKTYEPASLRRFRDAVAKYEYLFRVKHEQEIDLTSQDQAWFESFEASPEYVIHKSRFDGMQSVFKQWKIS